MATKNTYQNTLKKDFGINKNISEALTEEQCKELLERLQNDDGTLNLVRSFIGKNKELSKNNSQYGRQREDAKRKLEALRIEFDNYKAADDGGKETVPVELTEDMKALQDENTQLKLELSALKANNDDLMRDNRHLSNLVNLIKLRTTQGIRKMISGPDSEVKRELAKFLESTLG
ncbi:MAG: hypothetical protein AB4050_01785 [Synechococcus sp.]